LTEPAERKRRAIMLAAAVALAVALGVGLGVVANGSDSSSPTTTPTSTTQPARITDVTAVTLPASISGTIPTPPPPAMPSASPISIGVQTAVAPGSVNLAPSASIVGPPGSTRAELESVLQGRPPGWEQPGDATGAVFELTFAAPVTVTAIGMVPGDDASTSRRSTTDLWRYRRLVVRALVTFDDGVQYLVNFDSRTVLPSSAQTQVAYLLAPETTSHITIQIIGTRLPPVAGARNDTVLSQILVLGQ
jgi:hypothetical protein